MLDTVRPEPLLSIEGLSVSLLSAAQPIISDLSLTVGRGEIVSIVGESGSGKSMTALAAMRLLPRPLRVTAGRIWMGNDDLLSLSATDMNAVRGRRLAMLYQQPKSMLNPTATIGAQVGEAARIHTGRSQREVWPDVVRLLEEVGISEPERRARSYAHQLSGGMAQRVMIAAALSGEPDVLIADEPTTALDVSVQAQILSLLKQLQQSRALSIVLITHDFSVVASVSDRVAVMYLGRIVEEGATQEVMTNPRHPYTRALLKASMLEREPSGRFYSLPGGIAAARLLTDGCRFSPRCSAKRDPQTMSACTGTEPRLESVGGQHSCRCWLNETEFAK